MTEVNETQESVVTYLLVTSKCKTHGAEGPVVYGVRATRYADDFAEIEDISTDKEEVEQLIFRLKKGRVSPDQLQYIAEDYLVELSNR